ncbi:hypothetical protein BASA81_002757 [Batrachochytrium salamandrivorans]|nr:hypothetical protein BASA81_002757 [Batrachochytrium salamandrivorans]
MSNYSSDLIWQVSCKNSSFLVKRGGVTLSCEPGNVANVHSSKFSGLSNKKTVDIKRAGETVTITLKKAKDASKPAHSNNHVIKMKAGDTKRVQKTVQKLVGSTYYNPALVSIGVKRVEKLAQASLRANKMAAGKFDVKYGRGRAGKKAFPFSQQVAKKAPKVVEEAAPATNNGDEMD